MKCISTILRHDSLVLYIMFYTILCIHLGKNKLIKNMDRIKNLTFHTIIFLYLVNLFLKYKGKLQIVLQNDAENIQPYYFKN